MNTPLVRRAALAALALRLAFAVTSLLALAPAPARATMEEYSSFDVAAEEEDDESLLDHVLTRHPLAWRDEWERSTQAFRSAQGCLTSGQWFMQNELKMRSPLGARARFDLGLAQVHSNEQDYDVLRFGFRFPTRYGTAAADFMPLYDKSKQDLALSYELGADTSAFLLRATWGVEDVFNNLWAFRQTRVGKLSEPYLRHPYEPGLRIAGRGARWRAELGGRWMTPSRKAVAPYGNDVEWRVQSLWGSAGWAAAEVRVAGITWGLASTNQQVLTTDAPQEVAGPDRHTYRRRWQLETTARRALGTRVDALARWIYQERAQRWGEGAGPGAFDGLDRLTQVELTWRLSPRFACQAGGMYDRIGIAKRGVTPDVGYGTRKESRAYIGLMARFGRVVLQGVEGIELDAEPYDVWLVHDKGFLHLQTTF